VATTHLSSVLDNHIFYSSSGGLVNHYQSLKYIVTKCTMAQTPPSRNSQNISN